QPCKWNRTARTRTHEAALLLAEAGSSSPKRSADLPVSCVYALMANLRIPPRCGLRLKAYLLYIFDTGSLLHGFPLSRTNSASTFRKKRSARFQGMDS